MIYNISKNDLKNSQSKIDNQKNYLSSQGFLTSNGEYKTYLDVSMSANISNRYYAQLLNKINTLQQTMTNENLVPVFLTITLDGAYHHLLKGDFSKLKDSHIERLPNNDRFGTLRDYALNGVAFTPKDLYKLLRYQWNNFQNSRIYRDMKKGNNIGYLFAVEPHKSGVPHAHVILYVPSDSIKNLKIAFENSFPAKQNKKTNQISFEQKQNGETNSFQWTLSNPIGYVLKYAMKSFMDVKNQSQIDELQAWYIKHKIIRITTSHSLVPQWVYNKMYPLESDWLYLSSLKLSASCEWSRENNYIEITDTNKNQVLKYDNGLYQKYIDDKLVDEFGEKKEVFIKKVTYNKRKLISKTLERNKLEKPIKITKNYKSYHYYAFDDELVELPIVPKLMKNYELYNYYSSLDVEKVDLVHFGITQNECIKRGLIDDTQIQSLNDFNTNMEIEMIKKYDEVGINDTKTKPLPKIAKKFLSLPIEDVILPKDFDYSYSKDDKKIDSFPQGHFDFNIDIGA